MLQKKYSLSNDDLQLCGLYIAKLNKIKPPKNKNGKLILVTATSPTSSGEGKTTISINLNDALKRLGKTAIGMSEIDEAIDRVIAGPAKKSKVITEEEKKQIAYHEAGHALVGLHTKGGDVVEKITIIPRGVALAKQVIALAKTSKTPKFLYKPSQNLKTKIELIVHNCYGIDNIWYSDKAKQLIKKYNKNGFYVCMSKKPGNIETGFKNGKPEIGVQDILLNTGSKLAVVLCDKVFRMPGLPLIPRATTWK